MFPHMGKAITETHLILGVPRTQLDRILFFFKMVFLCFSEDLQDVSHEILLFTSNRNAQKRSSELILVPARCGPGAEQVGTWPHRPRRDQLPRPLPAISAKFSKKYLPAFTFSFERTSGLGIAISFGQGALTSHACWGPCVCCWNGVCVSVLGQP